MDANWIVSVDDHVVEPAHVWQERLPAKFRDVAPRVGRDDHGEAWFYEDKRIAISGAYVACGPAKNADTLLPITYAEMPPGAYDPKARLDDMNQDHVLASLCFPTVVRFCGQLFYEAQDRELALLGVRAYNDWMIDEWCAGAPGRLIPLIILPLWDPAEAAREIERCAAKGAKAIAFSENPVPLGLPSLYDAGGYWNPVLAAANETGLPICTHIGSSSNIPSTGPDCPLIAQIALTPMNAIFTAVDWLFSGVLLRFPDLKVCLSEGGIGWIPYVLERCDYTVERQAGWASKQDIALDVVAGSISAKGSGTGLQLDVPLSQLFREHIYGCFIDDEHGVENLRKIGIENCMLETDYPHTDTSFPNSLEQANQRLAALTPEEKYAVMRGNAERVFDFVPAEPPS